MAKGAKMVISDDDGTLRKQAARVNELTSGMTDYAGGVRYAIAQVLAQLEREKQRREAQKDGKK
jgi:hypothetical protein